MRGACAIRSFLRRATRAHYVHLPSAKNDPLFLPASLIRHVSRSGFCSSFISSQTADRHAGSFRCTVFSRRALCTRAVPEDLKYTDTHEWVKVDADVATVGITDHAQAHLGDIVFVELPEAGAPVAKGQAFGAVESVKATSDINSPISGEVTEANEELRHSPGLVNSSPFGKGWILKVKMSDTGELIPLKDANSYSKFCDEEESGH